MSLYPDPEPEPIASRKRLLGVGLGAGIVGACVLGMRWIIRPPTKSAIPETISPAAFSTHSFQAGRGQMIYHEHGQGPEPTLIFVHGLAVGASSYEWAGVYESFASTRRVLAPDLVGFGESERPQMRSSAEECAASLAEFVEGLCLDEAQKPVIVASGLGAGIATLMAAQNPELLSRLVLWMPTGRAETTLRLKLGCRLPTVRQFIYRNHLARRAAIRRRLATRAGIQPEATPNEAVEVYALCAQQYQADVAIYQLLMGRLDLDLPAAMRQVQFPVTVLWPDQATPAALEAAKHLAAENRLGSLRVVPGVNAAAPLLAPEALASVLRDELLGELRVLREAV